MAGRYADGIRTALNRKKRVRSPAATRALQIAQAGEFRD
jgi:hypothetical protein